MSSSIASCATVAGERAGDAVYQLTNWSRWPTTRRLPIVVTDARRRSSQASICPLSCGAISPGRSRPKRQQGRLHRRLVRAEHPIAVGADAGAAGFRHRRLETGQRLGADRRPEALVGAVMLVDQAHHRRVRLIRHRPPHPAVVSEGRQQRVAGTGGGVHQAPAPVVGDQVEEGGAGDEIGVGEQSGKVGNGEVEGVQLDGDGGCRQPARGAAAIEALGGGFEDPGVAVDQVPALRQGQAFGQIAAVGAVSGPEIDDGQRPSGARPPRLRPVTHHLGDAG